MNCKEAKEAISPYIDEALTPSERDAFSRHIRECSNCRRKYEEIQDVHTLLAGAEPYRAPEGFLERVKARTEAHAEADGWGLFSRRTPLFLKFAEAAFAVVIMIVGIISGNILATGRHLHERPPVIGESLSLDVFDSLPPESIGGAYISMTEVRK